MNLMPMPDTPKAPMNTARLMLRPLLPQEEDPFVQGIASKELRRMYGFPIDLPQTTARRIFRRFMTLSDAYGLVRNSDAVLVGFLLDVAPELPESMLRTLPPGGRTLAYAVFEPYQRQGYMKEALKAMIDRHRQAGTPYLHCGHFPGNEPSRQLLRSLGFTPHGCHALGGETILDEILPLS